ncbi:hypothetical protein J8273_0863 [Carpediemonas membranifera]|uniref:Uncharacterized protein n=1 Tax=Carpediemonas membranifera TaxID=201153 RepID=A0A8J6AYU3_9EUKA|nr:hypothetical protein J8273_0863 [Carpediemonas membranifera]|eukprot:KAG9397378.1 hypothetical protein J8273_0863 [Carpediemonas membranifera]
MPDSSNPNKSQTPRGLKLKKVREKIRNAEDRVIELATKDALARLHKAMNPTEDEGRIGSSHGTNEPSSPPRASDIAAIDWNSIPPANDVVKHLEAFMRTHPTDIEVFGPVNASQIRTKLTSGEEVSVCCVFFRVVCCSILLPMLGAHPPPADKHIKRMMHDVDKLHKLTVVPPLIDSERVSLCRERGRVINTQSLVEIHAACHMPLLFKAVEYVCTTLATGAFPQLMASEGAKVVKEAINDGLVHLVDPTKATVLANDRSRALSTTMQGVSWRVRPLMAEGLTPEARVSHQKSHYHHTNDRLNLTGGLRAALVGLSDDPAMADLSGFTG